MVGKYISLEMLIENNKDDYYRFLQDSSANWHDNTNNYSPFVKYYLGVILAAYRDFEKRTEHLKSKKKPIDRIRSIFDSSFTPVKKSMIQEKCPDIPVNMIEFHLKTLMNENYIIKLAGGRYASYIKNKK
jgi:Fic family protein